MATRRADLSGSAAFATGLTLFAGVMMIVGGILMVLQGIVALVNGDFYIATVNYTFDINVTGWGWMHIILGVLLALIGVGVVTGNLLARFAGIFVVSLAMIDNFLFIPYYPLWAIVLIAINALILWGIITAPARDIDM